METDPQSASIFTQLLILLVLTLIRGYFAGAEMAVASVNKNKIHRLKEQGNKKAAPRLDAGLPLGYNVDRRGAVCNRFSRLKLKP